MPTRNAIAIGITRSRLCAVLGSLKPGALSVDQVLVADLPATLDREDPQAVGVWVGDQLKSAGFPRVKATVALSRQQLAFKRMRLPTANPTELPEMTRLAMLRELPFDASSAVIDFLPVEQSETGTTVIAVAVPRNVLDFSQRMLKAAGLRCERISLRNMGATTLINGLGQEPGHGVLIIGHPNLPGTMPYEASLVYSRNVWALTSHLVKDGKLEVDVDEEVTSGCVLTHDGDVHHAPTAEALGLNKVALSKADEDEED